jgi:hypothetical protein
MGLELQTLHPLDTNIYSATGQLVGTDLAARVAEDDSIKRVFIFGEAGIGKSIIRGQLVQRIIALTGGAIRFYFSNMEDAMDQVEEKFGPRREWIPDIYDIMSDRLTANIGRVDKSVAKLKTRTLQVIESLSAETYDDRTGQYLNRAVSTRNKLAEQQNPQNPNTIFLGVNADPESQWVAGYTRTILESLPDHRVFEYLEEEHQPKIIVVGIDHTPEGGARVKAISQRQARADRLMDISQQTKTAALLWLTDKGQVKPREIWLPESVRNRQIIPALRRWFTQETFIDTYHLKAVFMGDHIIAGLGLPENYAMSLHNPFDSTGEIVWDLTSFPKNSHFTSSRGIDREAA